MTMANRVIEAARTTSTRLADRNTPFLFDCWYVAGFANEFAEPLLPRAILGRPLVLFRDITGNPIALSNR